MSVEKRVKGQFAKVFRRGDWRLFKRMADLYLERAARLKKSDLEFAPAELRLLVRNTQKRLLIGIGVELLLKAVYLKHGFAINKAAMRSDLVFPFALDETDGVPLDPNETFTLNMLIQSLPKVQSMRALGEAQNGLRVAKVFRNKEGHVATGRHEFDPTDYRQIEGALVEVYKRGFSEALCVRFSLAPRERAKWELKKLTQPVAEGAGV